MKLSNSLNSIKSNNPPQGSTVSANLTSLKTRISDLFTTLKTLYSSKRQPLSTLHVVERTNSSSSQPQETFEGGSSNDEVEEARLVKEIRAQLGLPEEASQDSDAEEATSIAKLQALIDDLAV